MPISPNQGSLGGGTPVTITGVNLAGALSVLFGDNAATITSNTPTSITVNSPAGCGATQVVVTTAGGSSNSLYFYYIPSPIMTSLSQNSGPTAGGNTVFINGVNLLTVNSVNVGANSSTPTIPNDSQISFVVPAAGPGQVNINVISSGGSSSTLGYTYYDVPNIDGLSSINGPSTGGQNVTIMGNNLSSTTQVTFGGIIASFGVISSTQISVITPPSTPGIVDVIVTTTAGSATSFNIYTYNDSPGI